MSTPLSKLKSPRDLSEAEAAERSGLAPSTLAKMRSRGEGPAFVKMGRRIRYPEDKLLAWIKARTHTSSPNGEVAA